MNYAEASALQVEQPLIVGIGGTTRAGSSTELALRATLLACERLGARTRIFGGADLLALPYYVPEDKTRTEKQIALVEAVREADGIVLASPGYHGGISALVKNALDLLEDLRDDTRVYFDGRPVGCVVTAAGWQGCNTTLGALRSVAHAMRGWPTPIGATFNTVETKLFASDGSCQVESASRTFNLVAQQLVTFARAMRSAPAWA
ncbi:NADPH-dependent FMN reductase [Paraburkholderia metrosideri]|uniref:NADPH-dependent FMN reductase-like domain-containing protein n=1 Tax=Paraburkholderia metrosideri TaxID=580937 RepID=A0ABN7I2J9_9BURK|nr:NAD(P)H-dependent oxidoreductase [Paraburkholderia metrosideri]CAD6543225.1 hypothetical protein LMG28140_03890 [Paraburkholderia metrosideri]